VAPPGFYIWTLSKLGCDAGVDPLSFAASENNDAAFVVMGDNRGPAASGALMQQRVCVDD